MADKYLTKTEILGWLTVQLEGATVADIPQIILDEAHAKVDSEIINKKCTGGIPSTVDDYLFLKFATLGFALSLLCQAGLITQTSGEVLTNKFGDVTYQFQRTNPLFFFAQGASKPFMDLLPYETLRMYAFGFIKAYCKIKFLASKGYSVPKPRIYVDKSSRGHFWNIPWTDYDIADSEYGDTLKEENE
jgi:hypothetical protein